MVDTLASGASVARRGGSSPLIRTKLRSPDLSGLFNLIYIKT